MKISLVAWSEPAGKFDPNAPLEGNEDNLFVDSDLAANTPGVIQSDVTIPLGEYGCLMVIADGMGGMNAGEVASSIAIETIKKYFAHDKITKDIVSTSYAKKEYLEYVIKEADKSVKIEAKNDLAKNGMGSTIIIAWLTHSGLTISWCGDSRAYLFEPEIGLKLLSEDHSYVQDLVKANKLDYNDTFDHPQGNIITRSLGDPSKVAQPETREFEVKEGDIILLCSDGLSGVLRDRKTKDRDGNFYPGENIEDIIINNQESLIECRKSLFEAAEKADWYDNVTVILCKVTEGKTISDKYINEKKNEYISKKNFFCTLVLFFILIIISNISTGYYFFNRGSDPGDKIGVNDTARYDTNYKDTLNLKNTERTHNKPIKETAKKIKETTKKTQPNIGDDKKNLPPTHPSPEFKDTLTRVETELTPVNSD